MKHMNEEITWEDALLQLEQVKDGRLPPTDTPTLANPLYARSNYCQSNPFRKIMHNNPFSPNVKII